MSAIIAGIQAIFIVVIAMVIPGGTLLLGAYLFRRSKEKLERFED